MSDTEQATPFVGDITTGWCPTCLKTALHRAPILVLVSTGPRRIGEWTVCEDCGYSPYANPEADLHGLEVAIREAARLVEDDSRSLGMMDAADMIRQARTS
ncbi:hypothetical protein [Nocardiopsis sp. NPDC058789]|uniref:hypothetical protein n=1 Tax=Nocardiopsis sp. NPDC058789 TaxID=3346634 RepID=UPI00366B444B